LNVATEDMITALVPLDPPWVAAITPSNIFISADAETWQPCARMSGDLRIYGIVQVSAKGLLAATSGGLRLSRNMGASWDAAGRALEGNTIQAICRHPAQASTLFAACHGRIYMSTDSGNSWSQICSVAVPTGSVRQVVVLHDSSDRLLVITGQQGAFILPLESGRKQSLPGADRE